jgi:hypothetical protein
MLTFFDYKGMPSNLSYDSWTGLTKGFHMDIDTSGVTIDNVVLPLGTGGTYNPIFEFETGNAQFRTDNGLTGTDYEKNARKTFTFMVVLMGGMFIVQVEQIKIHT